MTLGYLDNRAAAGGFITIQQWAKQNHFAVSTAVQYCTSKRMPAQRIPVKDAAGRMFPQWVVRADEPPPKSRRHANTNPKPRKSSRHPLAISVFEARVLYKASTGQLQSAVKTVQRMSELGLLKFSALGSITQARLTRAGWTALREAQALGMLSGAGEGQS